MRYLTKKELNVLKKICSLTQPGLKVFMSQFLRKKYALDTVIETDDFICAKGDIPIALVAHMDTVFKKLPENIYYDADQNVMWSPQGLGADDRAGVFAIISIINKGYRPHLILTTDEEIGGVGAFALTEFEKPFEDVRYLIQLDRRGSDDCVFYDCANPEFVKYVEQFGFAENWGSFSDISTICPEWGVAGVNLSIGYRNEHSEIETLHIGNMLNTIDKVENMLTEKDIPFFEYIEDPTMKWWESYYTKNASNYCYGYGGWDSWDYNHLHVVCFECGKTFIEEDTFPVRRLHGGLGYCCSDCIVDKVGWCDECTEAFEIGEDGDSQTCPSCKEKRKVKYLPEKISEGV